MNPLFANLPTSIFAHMSGLAAEHRAINLGQGFPDFGWPDDVLDTAAEALRSGSNQYAPMRGLPELREAVVAHYGKHQGLDISPEEVTVTSGATEALAAAILALVTPGDEVLLFQPLYDAYLPLVRRAGGVPRLVRLMPPDWRITAEALEEAVTERTRLVIFNNPHNPTSRLFGADELQLLADLCIRRDLTILSDEVWEHIVFDGGTLLPLAGLPGMRERTVKVGSAGKIFSLTGWKVGWIVAPPELSLPISKAHQYTTFATPPNLQSAVAYGLGKADAYFDGMRANFAGARDAMAAALGEAGFVTLPAQGSYFVSIDLDQSGIAADDVTFCERAVREAGVAAIPVSAFYDADPATNVVRLCFAKQPETIRAGVERLQAAKALFQ
ncbi:MAG: Aspartate aminotransferase [uncultured Sphingosinicella sp.]|uniref:aspartate transaminase n=1 Tax=uncultured Sphingosinicella sp. TaxID=478748 RepID=A0A6J4TZ88_9SPHN|nr:aminotransferase [uncultured Sphingosinicella sp.]CAA9535782.1 MAG: Aspartate aminotransferase [uncultured Sphingosinicella sp.]